AHGPGGDGPLRWGRSWGCCLPLAPHKSFRRDEPAWRGAPADRSVLRWAGLAGIVGGILFALTFVVVIAFALPDPGGPQALVRFPDIRAARTLENGLYLVAVILWVPLFIALDRVLRQTSLAPALGGSVVGILGLGVLAAGALPHVASARISDLY